MVIDKHTLYVPTTVVSREAAEALISAAIDAAEWIEIDVAVAVVDAGGTLKGFIRTDRPQRRSEPSL